MGRIDPGKLCKKISRRRATNLDLFQINRWHIGWDFHFCSYFVSYFSLLFMLRVINIEKPPLKKIETRNAILSNSILLPPCGYLLISLPNLKATELMITLTWAHYPCNDFWKQIWTSFILLLHFRGWVKR